MTDETTPSAGQSKPDQSRNATVIKKYANRRLYNTATSTYVTLEDLARMVKRVLISSSMMPSLARTSPARC